MCRYKSYYIPIKKEPTQYSCHHNELFELSAKLKSKSNKLDRKSEKTAKTKLDTEQKRAFCECVYHFEQCTDEEKNCYLKFIEPDRGYCVCVCVRCRQPRCVFSIVEYRAIIFHFGNRYRLFSPSLSASRYLSNRVRFVCSFVLNFAVLARDYCCAPQSLCECATLKMFRARYQSQSSFRACSFLFILFLYVSVTTSTAHTPHTNISTNFIIAYRLIIAAARQTSYRNMLIELPKLINLTVFFIGRFVLTFFRMLGRKKFVQKQ